MKAIKTLKQLTARFPDDVRIWNDYGVSNLIANRIEDAREAFRKVSVPTRGNPHQSVICNNFLIGYVINPVAY